MWGNIIAALLALAGKVLDIFREREVRQQGVQAQVAQDQKETLNEVRQATEARADVEQHHAADPDSVLAPDEFTRKS